VFVLGRQGSAIDVYTSDTAFAIDGFSFSESIDVSGLSGTLQGINFSPDGRYLYISVNSSNITYTIEI
jgi:hypothetical protein